MRRQAYMRLSRDMPHKPYIAILRPRQSLVRGGGPALEKAES